jgi:drug/metabolite transporter (DMT)-like permease
MSKSLLPYLSLTGGILCLSFSPVFVRAAQAPGLVTSFYRMSVAVLVLAPFALRLIRGAGPVRGQRGPAISWSGLGLGLLGGLFTAGDHGLWSTALGSTSVANATLFNYIAPLWVALFAAMVWRETLRLRFWSGLALVLGGMAIVISADMQGGLRLNPGDLIAAGSSLFYAAYFLSAQRGREQMPTIAFIWLVALGAAAGLLAACLVTGQRLSGYPLSTYLTFAAAGLFSQIGGYFLVAYALGHLPASLVAPTMIAQPVLSALLAIPLAHEPLSLGQILGGLAVLGGIYLVNSLQARGTADRAAAGPSAANQTLPGA